VAPKVAPVFMIIWLHCLQMQ